MLDIIIVGGGPAGLSAAITARQRGKSAAVISNNRINSGLYKAREVGNYPGLPGISGPELLSKMAAHASGSGVNLITGRVSTILPSGVVFGVGYDGDMISAECVILATGVVQTSFFPGEAELLGNGVSYCATCDGMLFRGKRVCVVCLTPEAHHEADYLASIGCDVIRLETHSIKIDGTNRVSSVTADDKEIPCDGVFIPRQAISPHILLPGLETSNGHILSGPAGETNIPGVFAAGDCTGAPYQIARATGQGQTSALAAAEYIDTNEKERNKS